MESARPTRDPFAHLGALDPQSRDLNAIIDTPKGSRNKYKLDDVSKR